MIPDYQALMRPVLEAAEAGEVRVGAVIEMIGDRLGLTADELAEMLPSGRQAIFANRVHWAKSYLKQAGLLEYTRRGHFRITDRGREVLAQRSGPIDNNFLEQFEEFQTFRGRTNGSSRPGLEAVESSEAASPIEALLNAHAELSRARN